MWLTLLPVLLQLLSELPGLIQSAEKAFGGGTGSGAMKKTFVLNAITTALGVYQQVAPHPITPEAVNAIQASVGSVIDTTVSVMNTAKVIMAPAPVVPKP